MKPARSDTELRWTLPAGAGGFDEGRQMRGEQGVPLSAVMLSIGQTMRAGDLAEAVEHHDLDAPRGGTLSDLGDICGSITALSAPLVVASRLQDQHARILAEHTTKTRQHLSGRVAGNACVLDTDTTSL